MEKPNALWTAKEAASFLRVHVKTLARWSDAGMIAVPKETDQDVIDLVRAVVAKAKGK